MVKISPKIKKYILSLRQYFINKKIIRNVYKRTFGKRVLIIYLTSPFGVKRINLRHSNVLECASAAEIFNDLEYQVDVVNYNSKRKINFENYEVIYGMGTLFEESFYSTKSKIKRIFYATGCNPIFSNIATTLKVRSFYTDNHILIPESSRILKESQHFQILLSDAVIILGNNYVKNTYLRHDFQVNRYQNLNAFYFDVIIPEVNKKNFSKARTNFVWFGSSGALHKGLDIVLEFFFIHPELTLHICGLNAEESNFYNFYKYRIETSNNIFNYGFVDIQSDLFKEIMEKSCFALFPTISEGGAVALLNVIANGALIPIYSEATGVDLKDYGCEVKTITLEAFTMAINSMLALDDENLKKKSVLILNHVRKIYSYENYKIKLRYLISKVLVE